MTNDYYYCTHPRLDILPYPMQMARVIDEHGASADGALLEEARRARKRLAKKAKRAGDCKSAGQAAAGAARPRARRRARATTRSIGQPIFDKKAAAAVRRAAEVQRLADQKAEEARQRAV